MRDLLHEVPSEGDAADLAALFHALGHPARLRLLASIATSGGMRVMELVPDAALNQATVSYHLRLMAEAGLIARKTRTSAWQLVPDALESLAGALGAVR